MHLHMNTLDSFQLAAEKSPFAFAKYWRLQDFKFGTLSFLKRGNRALLIIRANELQADTVGDTWVSE